jgi:hypothetical protein
MDKMIKRVQEEGYEFRSLDEFVSWNCFFYGENS